MHFKSGKIAKCSEFIKRLKRKKKLLLHSITLKLASAQYSLHHIEEGLMALQ